MTFNEMQLKLEKIQSQIDLLREVRSATDDGMRKSILSEAIANLIDYKMYLTYVIEYDIKDKL